MDGEHVETIFGARHRYEIRRKKPPLAGLFESTRFLIYRDGSFWKSADRLDEAVKKARDAG